MGDCEELAVLDLRGNTLSDLPPELARCTALVFLHVGGNKIAEFGPSLCEAFVNLQELYLYRNKLTFLPPEVRQICDCGSEPMITISIPTASICANFNPCDNMDERISGTDLFVEIMGVAMSYGFRS